MHHITRRLSPSLILASIALFVALAGTAAAAAIINSPDQIADRVVTSPKLAQPVVAAGVNQGLTPGDQPFLINPTSEVLSVEGPPAGANQGAYTIRFSGAVRHCQWTATPADIPGKVEQPTFIKVRPSQFRSDEVFVFTSVMKTLGEDQGFVLDEPASFYLMGRC
jgi:hypothetical protein